MKWMLIDRWSLFVAQSFACDSMRFLYGKKAKTHTVSSARRFRYNGLHKLTASTHLNRWAEIYYAEMSVVNGWNCETESAKLTSTTLCLLVELQLNITFQHACTSPQHIPLILWHFTFRDMNPQRLKSVSEINEEGIENEVEPIAPDQSQKNKIRSSRNPNQLHVTINTKPEEFDCDGNSSQNSNGTTGSNRRPSILVQEILSSRRPSAIMAAIRSPKQFVSRYRRE